ARQDAALSLRIAMNLAWLKRQDVSDLGYSSFAAFCREQVDWRGSWCRDLIRLMESPLDLVKAAASEELVPLRIAVRAPREVQPKDQEQWLVDQVLGRQSPDSPPERRVLEEVEGKDAVVVSLARHLARICLGRAVSNRQVDDYIHRCWRDRVPAEQILAEARERPPKPEWDSELSWGWCAQGGPAASLVGPWSEPESLEEAVGRVEALQAVRRGRTRVLARAWAIADHECLWMDLGFESSKAFAGQVLGWSSSTAQRYRRLGWALEWHPEIDSAVRAGLDLERAELLGRVVEETDVRQWLEVAGHVGRLELRWRMPRTRAVAGRRCSGTHGQLLRRTRGWPGQRPAMGRAACHLPAVSSATGPATRHLQAVSSATGPATRHLPAVSSATWQAAAPRPRHLPAVPCSSPSPTPSLGACGRRCGCLPGWSRRRGGSSSR
ncbi:MAG: hypothetical protein JRI25_28980, partial [Deltaproteobacteria bacterium]|nr:hypothetical protein [Deltaproteobacteria bacterium]